MQTGSGRERRRHDARGLVDVLPGERPAAPVLLLALDGFVDAGSAVRLLRDAALADGGGRVLAEFDVDQLVDYRYRRPLLTFERDRWTALALPRLDLLVVADEAGQEFLLLTGPEPDVQWQRFVSAVELVVRELGVRLVVGLDAVPLAVPHTRQLGVTVHSSEESVRAGQAPWFEQALVPGSAAHVLEYLLAERGIPTAGLAVHVPQYLAQADYPAASLRLAEVLEHVTGLRLPTGPLAEAAALVADRVAAEAGASAEIQEMIAGLEQQYDRFVLARATDGSLPSGDELGAEVERYLAEQARKDE
ncbi:putative ATP-grasp superfamily ATP-dependent carboligase [Motilibacter rhizosphaerae]|uniref:Putative ATP-grasp superfamily ATP-dependent carboligase n=1 Tax=Motilibacter rhizosphaerae TaxID=598652 RepID=A0A4Q7NNK1_9ACTN|nr:PAC2 family protein [Motilibacter rhizosphaerae]RZS86811.1 putative ATP-grasp superfamily ATP-dependent carboligase [Motilibacter rhizosphaerae]